MVEFKKEKIMGREGWVRSNWPGRNGPGTHQEHQGHSRGTAYRRLRPRYGSNEEDLLSSRAQF